MRVAVLSHHKSLGGGSRFVQGILAGLAELADSRIDELAVYLREGAPEAEALARLADEHPGVSLHLLADDGSVFGREELPQEPKVGLRERLRHSSVLVGIYRFAKFAILRRPKDVAAPTRIAAPPSPPIPQYELQPDVLGELERFDVVYLTWPRLLKPFDVGRPIVATFHDFNQRHGFAVFNSEERAFIDDEVSQWLSLNVYPVSSTPFIAAELNSFYPGRRHEPSVVYLSTFVRSVPSEAEARRTAASYGIPSVYLICPTNVGPHKNLPRMLRAFGSLNREGLEAPIVFTGGGTQMIGRDPEGEWLYHTPLKDSIDEINRTVLSEGLSLNRDFYSLGYLPDSDVDALISGAMLVVAPSLYEAGTGPGLDAWSVGTPVCVSNIPPVLQQMQFLKTKARTFDAEDESDIVRALNEAIRDSAQTSEMARESRLAMADYSWRDVALGYVDVFERALKESVDVLEGLDVRGRNDSE